MGRRGQGPGRCTTNQSMMAVNTHCSTNTPCKDHAVAIASCMLGTHWERRGVSEKAHNGPSSATIQSLWLREVARFTRFFVFALPRCVSVRRVLPNVATSASSVMAHIAAKLSTTRNDCAASSGNSSKCDAGSTSRLTCLSASDDTRKHLTA
eukprot:5741661-Amphidinium_carterae.1